MMWLTTFFVLLSVTGSYSGEAEEICSYENRDQCESLDPGFEFPKTSKLLLERCRNLEEYGVCIIDVAENCGDVEMSERVSKAIDFLKTDCQEDSSFFQIISSNLQCIESVGEKELPCINTTEKNEQRLREYNEIDLEALDDELKQCVYRMEDTICSMVQFDYYCGEDLKNALQEYEAHIFNDRWKCSEEDFERLKSYFELMEEVLLDEEALRDANSRK